MPRLGVCHRAAAVLWGRAGGEPSGRQVGQQTHHRHRYPSISPSSMSRPIKRSIPNIFDPNSCQDSLLRLVPLAPPCLPDTLPWPLCLSVCVCDWAGLLIVSLSFVLLGPLPPLHVLRFSKPGAWVRPSPHRLSRTSMEREGEIWCLQLIRVLLPRNSSSKLIDFLELIGRSIPSPH